MPLPVIPNTIRSACEGHMANGHKWAMVLHHRKDGALSYPAAIALLDPKLFALFNTNLGTGVALKATWVASVGLEALRYTPLDASTATTVISHVLPGTGAGDTLPANIALVATLRTGLRGRSFRGRTYLPAMGETANDPTGIPNAATVTNCVNQFAGYLTSLVATGLSLVVASYKLATATDVASVTIDLRWDTQRRRLNT